MCTCATYSFLPGRSYCQQDRVCYSTTLYIGPSSLIAAHRRHSRLHLQGRAAFNVRLTPSPLTDSPIHIPQCTEGGVNIVNSPPPAHPPTKQLPALLQPCIPRPHAACELPKIRATPPSPVVALELLPHAQCDLPSDTTVARLGQPKLAPITALQSTCTHRTIHAR